METAVGIPRRILVLFVTTEHPKDSRQGVVTQGMFGRKQAAANFLGQRQGPDSFLEQKLRSHQGCRRPGVGPKALEKLGITVTQNNQALPVGLVGGLFPAFIGNPQALTQDPVQGIKKARGSARNPNEQPRDGGFHK